MSYRRKHIRPKIRKLRKRNPFFKRPVFWIGLLLAILLVILVYFVVFSPRFKVAKIEVVGNEKITGTDIESLVRREASSRIFLVNSDKLKKRILSNFPAIESVVIDKKLSSTIVVEINERKPSAVFCPKSRCFFVDRNGVIFEEIPKAPAGMIIIKKEAEESGFFLGNTIVKEETMAIIDKVTANLRNNFQIEAREARLSDYLIFKTSEGWLVSFDAAGDIDFQITKLNLLLEKEILPGKRKNIQYIYLQYQDRAYYK